MIIKMITNSGSTPNKKMCYCGFSVPSVHLLFYTCIILVVSVRLVSTSTNSTPITATNINANETHYLTVNSLVNGGGQQNATHLRKFIYYHNPPESPEEHTPQINNIKTPPGSTTWETIVGRWPNDLLLNDGHSFVQQLGSSKSSQICNNHTKIFLKEIGNLEPWAIQMLDATGKIPSNILKINLAWWGSLSECIATKVILNTTKYPGVQPRFAGQYCTVSLQVYPDSVNKKNSSASNAVKIALDILGKFNLTLPGNSPISVSLGLCLPSTCTENDVEANVQKFMDYLDTAAKAEVQACYSEEKHNTLDTATIIVISLWSAFGLLVVIGTLYEILHRMTTTPCWKVKRILSKTERLPISASLTPITYTESRESLDNSKKTGRFASALHSFSFISNARHILNVDDVKENLSVLHGLRFLTMSWIILGHTYFVGFLSTPMWDNVIDFYFLAKDFAFQVVAKGILGVDTFLFLSGLLVVYVALKKIRASGGRFNLLTFYVHRLIRLSPVYMMTIAWVAGPSDYLSTGGPLWNDVTRYKMDCHHTWWKSLLYISNFGNTTNMCVPHSWYISVDTQFYVITPLLLYPLYRFPQLGISLIILLISASCITTGVISYVMHLPSSSLIATVPLQQRIDYSVEMYIKPYCRLGPYGVGMIVGYLLLKDDLKTKIKPSIAYLLWGLTAVCNLSTLYGTFGHFISPTEPSILGSAIYNALSGTVWSMGLGWVTYACIVGYGGSRHHPRLLDEYLLIGSPFLLSVFSGFVNTLLSWKGWIPLSRLTYCAYLLHMIILYTFFDSRESKLHFDHVIMVAFFFGALVTTYGLSFLFSLMFEAPFIRLEKVFTDKPDKG